MADHGPTLWPIEPHTKAKHDILTYYLKAWFPILGYNWRRLLFVDGFAGPGEYEGGEDGSPILVLKMARDHLLLPQLRNRGVEFACVFIEERADRLAHLQRRVEELKLPGNFHRDFRLGTFEAEFPAVRSLLEQQWSTQAPSFIFIDPFGPTGFPMSLIQQIAAEPRAEILINFSYQSLNQWFLYDPSKHRRLTELFGDERWRPSLAIQSPDEKEAFLLDQYRRGLEERGWRGLSFRMINKFNQPQYYLVYGTKHPRGMLAMKSAMWSVAPDGDFQFSDLSNPAQLRLFSGAMVPTYVGELAELLFARRRGTTVQLSALLNDDVAWHPTCLERHLRPALQVLEYDSNPPKIVDVKKADLTPRRRHSYPEGCRITFAD